MSGGGANSLNPADQRAMYNTRVNNKSWQYLTSEPEAWKNGNIRVDCVKYERLRFLDIEY